jgi:hypothetical protein
MMHADLGAQIFRLRCNKQADIDRFCANTLAVEGYNSNSYYLAGRKKMHLSAKIPRTKRTRCNRSRARPAGIGRLI